jgi:hypothetical protein
VHPRWERFPLAGKEKQFPAPLVFLGLSFSYVIPALSLSAEMKHSDEKAFIGWPKQWNRDLGRTKVTVTYTSLSSEQLPFI